MKIGTTAIGTSEPPYVIAEVGINARDDLELAEAHIDAAAEAGADAVKFQTHIPQAEMVQSEMEHLGHGDVFDVVAGNQFTKQEHKRLQSRCAEKDVNFLSTPFSTEAVELLDDIGVPAIKIGSGELTNYPLLRKAAETGRPLLISTGMSDFETIQDTFDFIEPKASQVALLYCVSAYPADPDDMNLDTISRMKDEFGVPIGFSDHSTGTRVSSVAMAKGADFVEKHFTIDRRLPGPDQAVSIEPEEMAELAAFSETVQDTRGHEKEITQEEADVKLWARHSVVTTSPLSEGDVLSEKVMTTKRPGTGIPAEEFYSVVGRTLAKDLEENSIIHYSDLKE
ncbi:N-acetylneuraminate synthase family protein [Halobaculum limi]|uniref:N-acetylneuraminate synthase family protein n=1 Tax=Halobaculum limi TaxID=3031916 RepID=UPI0024053FB7|nr:N-acetylneuraminate synthase family protein [Halobaculum sp. YSMS11]